MGKPIRILHVDDDEDFLEVMRGRLGQLDDTIDVVTATSCEDAIDQLEHATIDCILADYDMPGCDGIELLCEVRDRYGDLPFILFTGKGGEEIAGRAISHGVTDYLQKRGASEQLDLLVNRIQNAVGRHRAETALTEHVRRLETLVANIPGVVYRCDDKPPWPMRSIRGDFTDLSGYAATEFVHGELTWGDDLIHPADREAVNTAVEDGLENDDSFEIQYRIKTASGGTRWVLERGQRISNGQDEQTILEGFVTDITSWHHQRERHRVLFEDAADAIVEVGFEDDLSIIYRVNPAFETIFGADADEVVGRPINQVIVPEEARGVADDIDRRVQEGEIVEEELQRITADGPQWFLLRTVPFILGDERRAYATYVDISQQKEREASIEALHTAARGMYDQPDPAGILERTVHAAADVLGLSTTVAYTYESATASLVPAAATDAISTDLENLPRYSEGDNPIWTSYIENETILVDDHSETAQFPANGSLRVNAGLIVPIGTHGVLISMSSDRDAFDSADIRLAGLLASSTASALEGARREVQLTELHDAAMSIGSTDDPEEVYELLIQATEEVLEFDFAVADAVEEDELVTKATSSAIDDASFFETTPVDAEDSIAAASFRSGASDLTNDLRELDVVPADPDFLSALTVPINGFGIFQAAAKRQGAFDETDLEFAELLVSHAREALTRLERSHELEARTKELNRQNDRLEQFAGIVSHDLRNPLNVIAGRLELARDDTDGDEHLDAIEDAVDRMEAIIEHTLALAREGRTVGDTEAIDLDQIATGCWARVATGSADLEIENSLRFSGDPERVRHIFENLFRNAIEHTAGPVTVRVGAIGTSGFYVADDGPGIPESERDSIFEPGYTTADSGVGIGLAIVTEIVEAHGWVIGATESEDGGARFEITGLTRPE